MRKRSIGLALMLAGLAGCGAENTAGPIVVDGDAESHGSGRAIVVSNTTELVAALSAENAGRRIVVRAGTYSLDAPLQVPDGTTLEGEGRMRFTAGQPTGFAPTGQTVLVMAANLPGNILTLGNGASVKRVRIEDLPGRLGNAIGVLSREAGERVSASISETEIINPNAHGVVPDGPTGCGLTALTLNPGLGADPLPHEGAAITVLMSGSVIRSPNSGVGCGLFAFNFAANGRVAVALSNNVIGGGIIANGGVSRPNAVHDASTSIYSFRNLYRDDSPDGCATPHLGWNLHGGSGAPLPLPSLPETVNNTLRIQSIGDRISGFATGIFGIGGRRFAPTAGPSSGNSLVLELLGTSIATPSCSAPTVVADFSLAGAVSGSATLTPGDGNSIRAFFLGVTGSGTRANGYADVRGPAGPQATEYQGSGNQLRFLGTQNAFARLNRRIDPLPASELFTGQE